MFTRQLSQGVVHNVPADMRRALLSNRKSLTVWEDITSLARNEWICWIEEAKKADTRTRRITVMHDKMAKGMRRPCCWVGCNHR